MAPATIHLPNGQTLTVTPIFGGIGFKSNDLQTPHNVFPPGWTIIINSEDDEQDHLPASVAAHTQTNVPAVHQQNQEFQVEGAAKRPHHIHRFRKPSLRNDHLFISVISSPNSNDFRPASSPTRQIAMMLWATLWWYFHQPEPAPQLHNPASAQTPEEGKPKGEWIININREGIFKGKHLLPKLERMGLISSEDSTVGLDPEDGVSNTGEGWTRMFVSRKSFWQMDPRIYLFTLTPTIMNSQFPTVSPGHSRPGSPSRQGGFASARTSVEDTHTHSGLSTPPLGAQPPSLLARNNTPPGPYASSSNLPTFYPPPPLQYTFTNNIRHPIRPKPARQGETIYTRYVPSVGQYLSFRVASLSPKPCIYRGPVANPSAQNDVRFSRPGAGADSTITGVAALNLRDPTSEDTVYMSDVELLHKWMNDPRVAFSWAESGPLEHQRAFLETALTSRHSFPVIGCFDGKPFAFFEIYWVKEDRLSAHLGGDVGDWDRGLHVLVGEQEFRGPHRVRVWLSALVHYCWLGDLRTQQVFMEPRVDNTKLLNYAWDTGFYKAGEVTFPHKQSNVLKIRRDTWEAPAI